MAFGSCWSAQDFRATFICFTEYRAAEPNMESSFQSTFLRAFAFDVLMLNEAPAPNRRPRFPLGSLGEFGYYLYASLASPAAVGEACVGRHPRTHEIKTYT